MTPSTLSRRRWFFLLPILVLSIVAARAQERPGIAVTMGAGYGEGTMIADFSSIDNCPVFPASRVILTHMNLGAVIPFEGRSGASIVARGIYSYTRATATSTSDTGMLLLPGGPVAQQFEQRLESATTDLGLELVLRYSLLAGLDVGAGFFFGARTLDRWELTDHIILPSNMRYINPGGFPISEDGRTLYLNDGSELDRNPLFFGALSSLTYTLPITDQLSIAPEVDLRADLLSPVNGTTAWTIVPTGIVSIQYRLFGSAPTPTPILGDAAAPAPVPVAPPDTSFDRRSPRPLTASIDLFTLDGDKRQQTMQLLTTRSRRNQEVALTPFVLFDPGSTVLHDRYRRVDPASAPALSLDSLMRIEAPELQFHLLNIIGLRMRALAREKLRLQLPKGDSKSVAIARGRAESIRAYLEDVWRIAPSRISTGVTGAFTMEGEGVKLVASPAILGPLRAEWIEQATVTAPLQIEPHASGGVAPRSWTLTLRRGSELVASYSSDDPGPPALSLSFGAPPPGTVPLPLSAELVVRDSRGETVVARDTLPVEERR